MLARKTTSFIRVFVASTAMLLLFGAILCAQGQQKHKRYSRPESTVETRMESKVDELGLNRAYDPHALPSGAIIPAIKKDGYLYIPKDVFEDSVAGIRQFGVEVGNDVCRKQLAYTWESFCMDGKSILTITPEQIYYHTDFGGYANPRRLFWVMNITSKQYSDIVNGLRSKNRLDSTTTTDSYIILKPNDDEVYPDTWGPNETPATWHHYCEASKITHIKRYFSDLNTFIRDSGHKLKLPTAEQLKELDGKRFVLDSETSDGVR